MDTLKAMLTGTGGLLRVRGIVTIGAVGVTLFMWANGDTVSDIQLGLVTTWTAFYFGTRAGESSPS